MGVNPMSGADPPSGFPARFADLTDLYSPRLRAAAADARPGIAEGVYAGLLGGSYETPAEIAMLRVLGADLVGMLTVLEAIAARHLGAEVFGVSLVTNMAAGMSGEALDHEDVLARGRAVGADAGGAAARGGRRRPVTASPALRDRVEAWIAADPDPETRAELREMIAARDWQGVADRFAGRLTFGTAGLRGTMAAGPNRMNRVVVRQSTAGIARYLRAHVPGAAEAGVVVAHDARHRSDAFAADVAEVLGQHGIRTIGSAGSLPTPVAVHAIRAARRRRRDRGHRQPQSAPRQRGEALHGRRRPDHPAG